MLRLGWPPHLHSVLIQRSAARLQVWDVRSNQLVQHYSAHSGPVTRIVYHPSGDFLLSSSLDSTLKVSIHLCLCLAQPQGSAACS